MPLMLRRAAALLLGARHVQAVDIDPQALTATRDNAARNKVADKLVVLAPEQFKPDMVDSDGADVVLANILAGPLVDLASVLLESIGPGGALALSGILEEQADEVAAAYSAELVSVQKTVIDGWVLLTGSKPAMMTDGAMDG